MPSNTIVRSFSSASLSATIANKRSFTSCSGYARPISASTSAACCWSRVNGLCSFSNGGLGDLYSELLVADDLYLGGKAVTGQEKLAAKDMFRSFAGSAEGEQAFEQIAGVIGLAGVEQDDFFPPGMAEVLQEQF